MSRRMCNTINCKVECDRFGSIMVWGGICNGGKTHLIITKDNLTAQWYIDSVLQPVIMAFVCQQNLNFQQDNVWCHVALKQC